MAFFNIILNSFLLLSVFYTKLESKCIENEDFSVKCNGFEPYLNKDLTSKIKKIEYENLSAPILPSVKTDAAVNTFICSNCGLEILDEKNFASLTSLLYLDLSYNKIEELEPVFRHTNNLDVLNLRGNKISSFSRRVFADIPKLTVLDIGENRIKDLRNGTLILPNLSMLIMNDNMITEIGDYSFIGLDSISDLHLTRNKIYELSENCFRHNDRLKIIDLSYNKLNVIFPKTFTYTTRLQFLYLNGNFITTIPRRLFHQLGELQYLDLSGNKLTKLPEFFLKNSKLMYTLNLGYNKITGLSANMYQGLDKLKYLYLQHNTINYLNNSAFEYLNNLFTLNLAFNNIQSISRKAFKGLENLSVLVLTGNPISIQELPMLPNNIKDLYVHHCSEYSTFIPNFFEEFYNLNQLYCVEDVWTESLGHMIVEISADSGQALGAPNAGKKVNSRFYANIMVSSIMPIINRNVFMLVVIATAMVIFIVVFTILAIYFRKSKKKVNEARFLKYNGYKDLEMTPMTISAPLTHDLIDFSKPPEYVKIIVK